MLKHQLKNFTNGWFMGNFNPVLVNSKDFEIAVKYYQKGDVDNAHYHKIAKEYTVVVSGQVQMNDKIFGEGDIIEVFQNEIIEFRAITDAAIVAIKLPSVQDDKYVVDGTI